MAENQDGQEKSHEPSAKRLQEARRKGQVARSRELATMGVSLLGVLCLMAMGKPLLNGFDELFSANFALPREAVFDPGALLRHFREALGSALLLLLPFFAVTAIAAILSSIALGGLNFSTEAMQPKLSKLNPVTGLKRVFSTRGLMELGKALAKFLLIGGVTALLLWLWAADLLQLGTMDVRTGIVEGALLLGWSGVLLASSLVVVAAVDVPFQLWEHKRQLKMTQQEVREELKETEGRPEVRSRIRQLQRELAQRRMMEEIPKADVIVTNPTHYAVALRYDQERMRAPVMVAKGTDLVAANIRRVGTAHQVPQLQAPLLARAIYYNTELNEPIPVGLYLAVAQLLAYVYQLRIFKQTGSATPPPPSEFPIPEGMRTGPR